MNTKVLVMELVLRTGKDSLTEGQIGQSILNGQNLEVVFALITAINKFPFPILPARPKTLMLKYANNAKQSIRC